MNPSEKYVQEIVEYSGPVSAEEILINAFNYVGDDPDFNPDRTLQAMLIEELREIKLVLAVIADRLDRQ